MGTPVDPRAQGVQFKAASPCPLCTVYGAGCAGREKIACKIVKNTRIVKVTHTRHRPTENSLYRSAHAHSSDHDRGRAGLLGSYYRAPGSLARGWPWLRTAQATCVGRRSLAWQPPHLEQDRDEPVTRQRFASAAWPAGSCAAAVP